MLKRDESKNGYIADSVDKRLEITKSLGLKYTVMHISCSF